MNATPDMLTTSLKMLAALALVLAGLGAFFYFSKRLLQKNIGVSGGKLIRVLASQYIGLKKNIALVQIPGAILVVGIAGDTICLLTKIDDPSILDSIQGPAGERITPSFSEHLNKLTRRFTATRDGE
ncbi:MAG: flagellar biosynthetic protein FliO [Desulfobacterales bacterium]|jgi:flagellar biogenesis protein FliO